MKKMKLGNNAVSLAGEYAVLSQLALRGYDAAMAVGKTKGVDILVSDPSSQRMYRLEVKTNYGKIFEHRSKLFGNFLCSWIMGDKHETIRDTLLFYCFLNIDEDTKHFRFFIVPSEVVADYVRDQHAFWLVDRDVRDTALRQFRIGSKAEKYPIRTPTVENYEDNWDFRLP
jgi:hypothetical protein